MPSVYSLVASVNSMLVMPKGLLLWQLVKSNIDSYSVGSFASQSRLVTVFNICTVSLQSFDITPPKSFLSIIIIIIIKNSIQSPNDWCFAVYPPRGPRVEAQQPFNGEYRHQQWDDVVFKNIGPVLVTSKGLNYPGQCWTGANTDGCPVSKCPCAGTVLKFGQLEGYLQCDQSRNEDSLTTVQMSVWPTLKITPTVSVGHTEDKFFDEHYYLVLLEAPKYKLLTYNAAKKIQNETAPNNPQSKITVSNFHNRGAMFVFKQRK